MERKSCYRLNVCVPHNHMLKPYLQVILLGGGAFGRLLRLDEVKNPGGVTYNMGTIVIHTLYQIHKVAKEGRSFFLFF